MFNGRMSGNGRTDYITCLGAKLKHTCIIHQASVLRMCTLFSVQCGQAGQICWHMELTQTGDARVGTYLREVLNLLSKEMRVERSEGKGGTAATS
jgi:hypothetical protein